MSITNQVDIVEMLRDGGYGFVDERELEAAAEIERLRGLLREAREYLTPANETDEGCDPGECPECDMLRLGLRIDAALADRESAMHTDSVDEATVLPPSPSPSGTPQA